MHIVEECNSCKKDFMYHHLDTHLKIELESNKKIIENYPVKDDVWPSRRWNINKTEYEDLSGGSDVICQSCYQKNKK